MMVRQCTMLALFLSTVSLGYILSNAEELETVIELHNNFGIQMYRALAREADRQSNIIFSPLSVSHVLAMLLLGAEGNTADQLNKVLGFSHLHGNIHSVHRRLKENLAESLRHGHSSVLIANRLFGDKEVLFREDFVKLSNLFYGASLKQLDFKNAPDESIRTINAWVLNRTLGHVQGLLPPGSISNEALLVLVNTIFFKGFWRFPFNANETTEMDFHFTMNKTAKVNMMHVTAHIGIGEIAELQCRLIEIPYEGNLAVYIILPNAGVSLTRVESRMNSTVISKAINEINDALLVNLSIPKFQLTKSFNLVNTLSKLGIRDIFNPNKADFSNMTRYKDGRVAISAMFHKTAIEFNEDGTIAAAATGAIFIPISVESPFDQVEIKVDRPFIYFISDKKTKSTLFMGRLMDPPLANADPVIAREEKTDDQAEDSSFEEEYVFEPIEKRVNQQLQSEKQPSDYGNNSALDEDTVKDVNESENPPQNETNRDPYHYNETEAVIYSEIRSKGINLFTSDYVHFACGLLCLLLTIR